MMQGRYSDRRSDSYKSIEKALKYFKGKNMNEEQIKQWREDFDENFNEVLPDNIYNLYKEIAWSYYLAACKKRQEEIDQLLKQISDFSRRSEEDITALKAENEKYYNDAYGDDSGLNEIELRERVRLMHSWVKSHQGAIERKCEENQKLRSLLVQARGHIAKADEWDGEYFIEWQGELDEWLKECDEVMK